MQPPTLHLHMRSLQAFEKAQQSFHTRPPGPVGLTATVSSLLQPLALGTIFLLALRKSRPPEGKVSR